MSDRVKYLVVTADDLGISVGINRAVEKAHKDGVLTSASLCVNGGAFKDAVERVIPQCGDLGVGLHVCLNEGKAVSTPKSIPCLVDSEGRYKHKYIDGFLFLWRSWYRKDVVEQVRTEISNQMETALRHTPLFHVNGHMHVHCIPWIFDTVVDLSEKFGIKWIRYVHEPFDSWSLKLRVASIPNIVHFLNLKRWALRNKKTLQNCRLRYNDVFRGVLHSGFMTEDVAIEHLSKSKKAAITEILFHPAYVLREDVDAYDEKFAYFYGSSQRARELDSLTSKKLLDFISGNEYQLTNYRKLTVAMDGY